jgi:hypothetical protein
MNPDLTTTKGKTLKKVTKKRYNKTKIQRTKDLGEEILGHCRLRQTDRQTNGQTEVTILMRSEFMATERRNKNLLCTSWRFHSTDSPLLTVLFIFPLYPVSLSLSLSELVFHII